MQKFPHRPSSTASFGENVTHSSFPTQDQMQSVINGWTFDQAQETAVSSPRIVQLWRTYWAPWNHYHLATLWTQPVKKGTSLVDLRCCQERWEIVKRGFLHVHWHWSFLDTRETPHHGLWKNLAWSEKEFAEKVEREAKSGKRELKKKMGRKARSKPPEGRSKTPKGRSKPPNARSKTPKEKGGQRKLQMTTVFWDPALPRCLKRSITGENISCHGCDDEQKLLLSFPWMCSLKEAGFSGRHRCGVTLLSGNEYFDICWLAHIRARCLCLCALPFVCVPPDFEPTWQGQTTLDHYMWDLFHRTWIIRSNPRVCSSL